MNPVYVTKTFLPPLEEYIEYLKEIWATKIVTKDGPFLKSFGDQLKTFSTANYAIPLVNGTFALQLAIKALRLKGEILTTPFTLAPTGNAIVWEGCHPVFVDIAPHNLKMDQTKIENKFPRHTAAILP